MSLSELTPHSVWRNFAMLCAYPRPSGKELARDHRRVWAESLGLATQLDGGGNLIIRKRATPGMAERRVGADSAGASGYGLPEKPGKSARFQR